MSLCSHVPPSTVPPANFSMSLWMGWRQLHSLSPSFLQTFRDHSKSGQGVWGQEARSSFWDAKSTLSWEGARQSLGTHLFYCFQEKWVNGWHTLSRKTSFLQKKKLKIKTRLANRIIRSWGHFPSSSTSPFSTIIAFNWADSYPDKVKSLHLLFQLMAARE